MEEVPSPKFQLAVCGIGNDALVIVKALPAQIFVGNVKSALTEPIMIEFVCVAVSAHPVEFVTIKVTV